LLQEKNEKLIDIFTFDMETGSTLKKPNIYL